MTSKHDRPESFAEITGRLSKFHVSLIWEVKFLPSSSKL